jgi:hypothetical protein
MVDKIQQLLLQLMPNQQVAIRDVDAVGNLFLLSVYYSEVLALEHERFGRMYAYCFETHRSKIGPLMMSLTSTVHENL